ncbi:hypothetical protein CMI38_02095 [Candidatus Pacearchaeota archaeon]|jgi:hypothetical protein|nr:hypothetical protein [Candidatus Pacearchaeota archaeon]|tara:strand:- start:3361 stop:4113 length:753 start_codon:yes stop_codon:yes gene_type:complete
MGDEVEFVKDENKASGKFKWKLYLGLVFVGLLLFIGYTSFFNPDLIGLTGNAVGVDKEFDIEDAVGLNARLGIPGLLVVDSGSDKLSIRVSEQVDFLIGDQKVRLSKGDSIVVDDFGGRVSVEGKTIVGLEGRGSRVFIDGLPISHKSDSLIKLSVEGLGYSYMEFENVYLESLSYITSGLVRINEDKLVIRLDEESFAIDRFKGDLTISNDVRVDGKIDRSNVDNLVKDSDYSLEEELEDDSENEDSAE